MRHLIIFLIFLSFLLFIPDQVLALTISPLIIDAAIDPGQSGVYEVKLYNETNDDIFISAAVEKFRPQGENGQARILSPDITDTSVNWIKLPANSLVLKPAEIISVPVIINIPKTAEAGGYYLAVMWESSAVPKNQQSHQALIASRVGTLVLLEVPGETKKGLEIIDFNLKENKKFYNSWPIGFLLRLRNYGNVHLRPQGSVIIKDFTGQTIEALPFNSQGGAILPQTVRSFELFWGDDNNSRLGPLAVLINQLADFKIGRFSAKTIIDYGNQDDLVSEPVYFWIFPWPSIISLVVIAVVMIFLSRWVKKK